jgi:hypothetical protein
MDEDLLGCFLNGGGDLAFDELAAFEAGAGTDEGNEVGRVDGAPAGWAASISMKASLQRPGPVRRGLLRWLIPPCAMDTDTVLSSTSASLAPAGYRFPREFECAFWDVRAGVKMGWWGRPPTPTIT